MHFIYRLKPLFCFYILLKVIIIIFPIEKSFLPFWLTNVENLKLPHTLIAIYRSSLEISKL